MTTLTPTPTPTTSPTPTIDIVLNLFGSTLSQVGDLVKDIPEARMAEQFPGVVNHPAWTLGHLCMAAGFVMQLLDANGGSQFDDEMGRFGPGSVPVGELAKYESKAACLTLLADRHERAAAAVRSKHAAYFDRPSPDNLKAFAPTLGRIIIYLLAAHESYHLGQLAQWRRAAGIKKA